MHQLPTLHILIAGISILFGVPVAAQSTALDTLPAATQEEISRVCLPVQFREGATAYRNCVQAELSLQTDNANSALSKLSFDDKYAVQQACATAGGQSQANYKSCVSSQVSELQKIPAPQLDSLPDDELYAIQQSCFSAQSKEGAASYRNCLNRELNGLLSVAAADTSQLTMLEKNALQLRCSATSTAAADYRRCVAAEFESIAGTVPTLLPISTAVSVVKPIQTAPQTAVVNEAVEQVAQQTASAETSTDQTNTPTMVLPRNINPDRADATTQVQIAEVKLSDQNAASDSTSIAALSTNSLELVNRTNTLRDATSTNGATAVTDTQASTNTAAATGTERIISRPELVQALEEKALSKTQALDIPIDSTTDVNAATNGVDGKPDPMKPLKDIWAKLVASIASLDRIGWLIIAAALALPALLLGIFSVARRRRVSSPSPINNVSLTERIEPGLQTRKQRHEREAAELFGDDDFEQQSAAEKPSELNADLQSDDMTRIAAKPQSSQAAASADRHDAAPMEQQDRIDRLDGAVAKANAANDHNEKPSHRIAWQSAFGQMLANQPASQQRESCMEFLIYWMAYGDERYEPELKKKLFTATDLNQHDQIKRWVLKQDVFAFADVVSWLRLNATETQLDQFISLVMALLVTENSVTPVQNTLLRFFADAFGIGKDALEHKFEQAFGHPLPPVPRVDNKAWWVKQDSTQIARWDPRSMATRPELDQMLARLGLADNYDEADVIQSFRRASRRCHPDRFTALGDREKAMAEQRFTKFEEARDKLLGVSV